MKDVTTTKKLHIKLIAFITLTVLVLAGIVAFLTVTSTGRAIVFAITDPATVNHAADMKADYVKQFSLTAEGPKAE